MIVRTKLIFLKLLVVSLSASFNPRIFFMKSSLLLAASVGTTLLISACQNVAVETNVSPSNFEEYFKPSSVEVYDKKSILDQRYHSLGLVVGLACQEKPDDFVARDTEARSDALIQTADMGGNGIVFNKCIRLERTQSCHVSVTCYAEAFVVDNGKPNQNAKNLQAQASTKKKPQSFDKAQQANPSDDAAKATPLVAPVVAPTEPAVAAAPVPAAAPAVPVAPEVAKTNTIPVNNDKAAVESQEIKTFKIDDSGIENMTDNMPAQVQKTPEVRESKQLQRRNRMYKIQLD